jgi:hypothetical protein
MGQFHIRVSKVGELGVSAVASGSQSIIVTELAKLGFGIEEMGRGKKEDMIRVKMGIGGTRPEEEELLLRKEWEV